LASGKDLSAVDLSHQRFCDLLDELAVQGINQQDLARRLGIAPQYLSDVKSRRRGISELFARRLEDLFDRRRGWFLGRDDDSPGHNKRLDQDLASVRSARTHLPAFAHPVKGDPYTHPLWDGAEIEICGVAAIRALDTHWPYLLRLGSKDQRGRLKKNDLLLVSQQIQDDAEILVLEQADKAFLARRKKPRGWEALSKGRVVTGNPEVIGACLGIVWAAL
jgi:transcriptional regulator with XRE-family HTH domain